MTNAPDDREADVTDDQLIPRDEHRRLRTLHKPADYMLSMHFTPPTTTDQYGRTIVLPHKDPNVICGYCRQAWPCPTIERLDADIARREATQ